MKCLPLVVMYKRTVHLAQGEHVWVEPVTRGEFDVALGARVISKAEGGRIQVGSFLSLSHSTI